MIFEYTLLSGGLINGNYSLKAMLAFCVLNFTFAHMFRQIYNNNNINYNKVSKGAKIRN